jgi:3-oxoacyl-[acyl-carrier protein] reductase
MFADLTNKIAIVTGSGQGIGAGVARVFAGAGAKVMVVNRTPENGQRTVDEIRAAGGEAELCGVDIGNVESVGKAVADTVDQWGGVDIMLHNAASFLGGPVAEYTEEDLETVLSVNLKACFRFS